MTTIDLAGLAVRAQWVSREILPREGMLRAYLARTGLPAGLDLDDVIQEAYARLAQHPDVKQIRTPGAYLVQMARSIVVQHVRKARIIPLATAENMTRLEALADERIPEMHIIHQDLLGRLAKAIITLTQPTQTAFTLRFIHELSYKTIGEQLGLSENAVQKLIARSLKTLKHHFDDGGLGASEASLKHDVDRQGDYRSAQDD